MEPSAGTVPRAAALASGCPAREIRPACHLIRGKCVRVAATPLTYKNLRQRRADLQTSNESKPEQTRAQPKRPATPRQQPRQRRAPSPMCRRGCDRRLAPRNFCSSARRQRNLAQPHRAWRSRRVAPRHTAPRRAHRPTSCARPVGARHGYDPYPSTDESKSQAKRTDDVRPAQALAAHGRTGRRGQRCLTPRESQRCSHARTEGQRCQAEANDAYRTRVPRALCAQ